MDRSPVRATLGLHVRHSNFVISADVYRHDTPNRPLLRRKIVLDDDDESSHGATFSSPGGWRRTPGTIAAKTCAWETRHCAIVACRLGWVGPGALLMVELEGRRRSEDGLGLGLRCRSDRCWSLRRAWNWGLPPRWWGEFRAHPRSGCLCRPSERTGAIVRRSEVLWAVWTQTRILFLMRMFRYRRRALPIGTGSLSWRDLLRRSSSRCRTTPSPESRVDSLTSEMPTKMHQWWGQTLTLSGPQLLVRWLTKHTISCVKGVRNFFAPLNKPKKPQESSMKLYVWRNPSVLQ